MASPTLPASVPVRGTGLMLLSVGLFSLNVLCIKLLAKNFGVDAVVVNVARGVVGMVLVGYLCRCGRAPIGVLFRHPLLIARGLCGGSALLMGYIALAKLDLGVATTLTLTYVPFGAVLAAIFLKEQLRGVQVVFLVLAFSGIPFLLDFGPGAIGRSWYEGLALLGGMIAGVTVVLIRRLSRTFGSVTIFGAQSFYGFVVALPFVLLASAPSDVVAWIAMLAGGLLGASGQLVMTAAYRLMPVARGAALQLLVPVLATLGGVVFFGEAYSPAQVVGGLLVLGGAGGLQWSRHAHA
ncbi:MAG: DMT family transporter [Opitutales bacterium]